MGYAHDRFLIRARVLFYARLVFLLLGLGVANVFTMFFAIFAGIRMLQLRNYGLVFFGALVSAVPCISGSSCCCIGEAAGIYAIILLLQSDIRDAFR